MKFQDEDKICYLYYKNVKEDVKNIFFKYISRCRIEEYFRFKKQNYKFEDFRVRSPKSINNLNMLLTFSIGLNLALAETIDKKLFVLEIIEFSKSLKKDITFWLYQIAKGIFNILTLLKKALPLLKI